MSAGWYCVNTKARNEDLAVRHLTRRGYTVLFPQFVHPNSKRMLPLFPGYIFLNFDHNTCNWKLINTTEGVQRLFMVSPDRPSLIPNEFIDRIQWQIQQAQWDASKIRPLHEHDKVRVVDSSSPWHMFEGDVFRMSSKERVEVLMSVFGRDTSVEFELSSLKRIT